MSFVKPYTNLTSFRLQASHILALKLFIHLTCLALLVDAYYWALLDQAGGDPVETILHFTGIGAFNLLLLCLLVSPAAKWLQQSRLIQLRRLIGIYAFAYAFLHFASFVVFEMQLEWSLILSEVVKRPYITVGFAALLILFSLTLTSAKIIQKKMGRRWQILHHGIYLAGLLVALHYIWSVKSAIAQPLIYWGVLLVLLALRRRRVLRFYRKRSPPSELDSVNA